MLNGGKKLYIQNTISNSFSLLRIHIIYLLTEVVGNIRELNCCLTSLGQSNSLVRGSGNML